MAKPKNEAELRCDVEAFVHQALERMGAKISVVEFNRTAAAIVRALRFLLPKESRNG